MVCVLEGVVKERGSRAHTPQPYASCESAEEDPLPSLPSTHKNTKLHCSPLSKRFSSKQPHRRIRPTLWAPQKQIRRERHWSHLLTTAQKLVGWKGQEQRWDVLLSPVCVPSVCKLHQQHELDQQEEEPTSGSYVAPHCRDRKCYECLLDEALSGWVTLTTDINRLRGSDEEEINCWSVSSILLLLATSFCLVTVEMLC